MMTSGGVLSTGLLGLVCKVNDGGSTARKAVIVGLVLIAGVLVVCCIARVLFCSHWRGVRLGLGAVEFCGAVVEGLFGVDGGAGGRAGVPKGSG